MFAISFVLNGFEATEAVDDKAMVDKGVDAMKENVAGFRNTCQLIFIIRNEL